MFESLGYAGDRRGWVRRAWSLPLAFGVQFAVLGTYGLYSLFVPEVIPAPPTWISSLPAIPITLVGGGHHAPPREQDKGPKHPPKRGEMVAPDINNLTPTSKMPDTGQAQASAGDDDDGPSIPGLEELPGLGFGDGSSFKPEEKGPSILQGWQVTIPKILTQVQPIYPAAALAMRIGGKVVLQLVVNEEGRVTDVQVLSSSNALFNQAAIAAVRQWRYTRPLAKAGGQAVACYTVVSITFEPT